MGEEKVGKAERKGSYEENEEEKVGKKAGSEVFQAVKKIVGVETVCESSRKIRSLTFSVVNFDGTIKEHRFVVLDCE